MVWRIVVGLCIFGFGWFVVEQYVPNVLPRIDIAVMTAVKHIFSTASSSAIEGKDTKDRDLEASPQSDTTGVVEKQAAGNEHKDSNDKRDVAIEESGQSENMCVVEQAHNDDKDGKDRGRIELETCPQPDSKQAENNEDQDAKDTRNFGLKDSPQREIVNAVEQEDNGGIAGEPGSTTLYHSGKRVGYHATASFEQNDYTSVGEWEEMRGLLYEKVMDRLIPEDLRIIYRAARRALQRVEWPEWMGDVDCDKACLLLLSTMLWVGFATYVFFVATKFAV